DTFDERDFFAALAASGARVLLIGRRAIVALGAPLLTADYDVWVHIDDVERLNAELALLGLVASCTPAEARARGRYVLESGERVDVMVARSKSTKDGVALSFDDAWARRTTIRHHGVNLALPSVDDLILTKRWAMREKDLSDIAYLEDMKRSGE